MNSFIVIFSKILIKFIGIFNLGNGSTWPGELALNINKNFINQILSKTKTILVIGTNGKTTTAKLLETILKTNGFRVMLNSTGANLLNGVASEIIKNCSLRGNLNLNYAIFEIDENTFPEILKTLTPQYIICLNLFRDQLDRYGELEIISKNWSNALKNAPRSTLILNADDPQIAYLGIKNINKSLYFGIEDKDLEKQTMEHASDSIFCPNCKVKLNFKAFYFSHLGLWECLECKLKRPNTNLSNLKYYPLTGTYAKYDVLAAALCAKTIGLNLNQITSGLKKFIPVFGRQEKITYKNKNVQIFLAKNPTGFNQSLDTILKLNGKNILIILNNQIPDGTDISWIWDTDLDQLKKLQPNIVLSGERVYDLALRFKYAQVFTHITENLNEAIESAIKNLEEKETLFILPTYSAMLEARKILTGKKIL